MLKDSNSDTVNLTWEQRSITSSTTELLDFIHTRPRKTKNTRRKHLLIQHHLLTQNIVKYNRLEAWNSQTTYSFFVCLFLLHQHKTELCEEDQKFEAWHLKMQLIIIHYLQYLEFHKCLYFKMTRSVVNICCINPVHLHFAISWRIGSLYMQRREMALWPLLSPLRILLSAPSYQSSFHFVSWQQTSQTLLLVLWPLTPH